MSIIERTEVDYSRILVIDSENRYDEVFERIINKFGYGIIVRSTVEAEIYNNIEEYLPGIVIIDFELFERFTNKNKLIEYQKLHKIFVTNNFELISEKQFDLTFDIIYFEAGNSIKTLAFLFENALQKHFLARYSEDSEERVSAVLANNSFAIIELDVTRFIYLIKNTPINDIKKFRLDKKNIDGLIDISYINAKMMEYFEAESFEAFDKNIINYLADEHVDLYDKLFEMLINNQKEFDLEGEFRTFKNNIKQILWKLRKVDPVNTEQQKVIIVGIEISKYKNDLELITNHNNQLELKILELNNKNEESNKKYLNEIEKNKLIENRIHAYSSAFLTSKVPMCYTDTEGRFKLVNNALIELLGYSDDSKLINRNAGIIFKNPKVSKHVLSHLYNKMNFSEEVEIFDKTGNKKTIYLNANSLFDANGDLYGYLGVLLDLTTSKVIQEELSESEEIYKFLINNIKDGIYMIQDGKVSFVNDALLKMIGYNLDEILGTEFMSFIAPEDREYVVEKYKAMIAEKSNSEEYSFNLIHKDRVTRILVSRAGTMINYKGNRVLLGRLIDITNKKEREIELKKMNEKLDEQVKTRTQGFLNANKMLMQEISNRKKTEEILRESELKLRIISEYISDYVYSGYFDNSDNFSYDWIQGAFKNITGYNTADLKTLKFGHLSIILIDDRDMYLSKLNMLRANQSLILQYRIRKPNGDIRWVKDYIKPIEYNEHTGICRVIGAIKDVTETLNNERVIKENQEQLIELMSYIEKTREYEKKKFADELQEVFSHSLTKLKMEISLLKNSISEENKEYFDDIISSTEQIINLIKKISFDLRPVMLDHFGLIAAVEWQIEQFKSAYPEIEFIFSKNIETIDLDLQTNTILFRIIQDLLRNAVQHSKSKMIQLSIVRNFDMITCVVEDNGIGFDFDEKIKQKSFGLISILERAKYCKADIIFNSDKNGTKVVIFFDLNLKIHE